MICMLVIVLSRPLLSRSGLFDGRIIVSPIRKNDEEIIHDDTFGYADEL